MVVFRFHLKKNKVLFLFKKEQKRLKKTTKNRWVVLLKNLRSSQPWFVLTVLCTVCYFCRK